MTASPAQAAPSAPSAAGPGSARRILLHCPDITLKGRNQVDFQDALDANVRHVLMRAGLRWRVGSARGRVYVETTGVNAADIERVVPLLEMTAGVSSLGTAVWLRPGETLTGSGEMNWPLIEQSVVALAIASYVPGASFAVRVNRVDKTLPVKSKDIEIRLGDAIRRQTQWAEVDLASPDLRIQIDAYPDGLYIYPGKHRGIGGLPVGTGGRVLALLSGGIDSPVAAFMLAKRGCTVDLLHMSAGHPRNVDPASAVIARLAQRLSRTTIRSRLYVVPYTFFDLHLMGRPSGFEMVLFRRFLMRCAEYLAQKIEAGALITGDSLGQVASQTLENLASSSRPVTLPVLRPLIGMNKQEIIEQGRRIGTYEISIEPYKDCCALIARHPRTRSRHEELSLIEQDLFPDYARLIADTFRETLCLEYDCGELTAQSTVEF